MNGKQVLYAAILFAGSFLTISCNKTGNEIAPGLDDDKKARSGSGTIDQKEDQYSTESHVAI